MKTYNLALLGFGNVGKALVRLLQDKTTELRDRYSIGWKITGVASRRLGWARRVPGRFALGLGGGDSPVYGRRLRAGGLLS